MNVLTTNQRRLFLSRWARSLYDWVVNWAATAHARTALFLIAFAEASFFPIPPDVLLIAMGVSTPKKAFRFAAICLAGSIAGGVLGYGMGMAIWPAVDQFFYDWVPGFTPERFEKMRILFEENVFFTIFTAGFTPIPFKIFTISAGVAGISFWPFLGASILSRGLRFYLVSGTFYYFGPAMKEKIEKYFDLFAVVFTLLGIGGFLAVKLVLGH